jgi:hypothetical protein
LAAEQVRANKSPDEAVVKLINSLSEHLLLRDYSNDLILAQEAYQSFFENLSGVSRYE